jgi:integrase
MYSAPMPERGHYGAGSLRARGENVWELRIRAGRDPRTGRQRQLTRSFHGTEKQARKALAAFVTEGTGRASVVGSTDDDHTVHELVDAWLEFVSDRVSPNTLQGYRSKCHYRILPVWGDTPLRRVNAPELERWYRQLLRDDGLAPSHVRQIHTIVHNMFGRAVRWRWLDVNPASAASPPGAPKREVRPPDAAHVLAAIEGAHPELSVFLRLTAVAGSRRGEVTALRWSDVDLAQGEVLFARSAYRDRETGEVRVKDTKGHGARRIALDHATVDALQAHRVRAEDVARVCEVDLAPGAFVFSPDADGARAWDPYHWTTAWRSLRARLRLPGHVRLHDLRHFAATQLLASGVDVRTVAGRLGHANPATTLNIYGHFVPAADRAAATKLGDLLTPKP